MDARFEQTHDELLITNGERELLTRRARELAQPLEDHRTAERSLKIVEFRLSEERYALEMEYAQEIVPLAQWTALPGMPEFVMGLLNVRGQIFSILDLRSVFGLAPLPSDANKHVILLRHGEMRFGIYAEAIEGVRSIAADNLQAPLGTLPARVARYVKAMLPGGASLLGARELLEDPDLVVNEI